MKIGFANLYSFRPHVEHLYYLSMLMRQAGHEVFFLSCDGSVTDCYPRALKGTNKLTECSKCITGGVRSYPVTQITSIDGSLRSLEASTLDVLTLSSSCTLNRTESELEWSDPAVIEVRHKLHNPVDAVYSSAMRWIEKNHLDAVICFNGRMDLTRAITYACEQSGIPYVTHERSWFGDGLHLVPNANCLSISAMRKMTADFDNKPLTKTQAAIAGKLAGERFLQRNSLEWRVYNRSPEPTPWPLTAVGQRVLVLPSSKNEFAGHEEWKCGWVDNTHALDDFFAAFGITNSQVVLRCHPNWAENIGKVPGARSSHLYQEWAKKRNIYCIASAEKASTYDLIQQADIVVMNGGSSAVEAGVCGKQVIVLGPASYDRAGFVRVFMNRDDLYSEGARVAIDPRTIIRKTLRYIYLRSHRFPQYVDYVRAIETTRYSYSMGADPGRLLSMLATGEVSPDDPSFSDDLSAENGVIDLLIRKEWGSLADHVAVRLALQPLRLHRRLSLRWIDTVRDRFPRGDRG